MCVSLQLFCIWAFGVSIILGMNIYIYIYIYMYVYILFIHISSYIYIYIYIYIIYTYIIKCIYIIYTYNMSSAQYLEYIYIHKFRKCSNSFQTKLNKDIKLLSNLNKTVTVVGKIAGGAHISNKGFEKSLCYCYLTIKCWEA